MRQALLIFNKEFKDYFLSPIAYIVIAVFLLVTGWLFFSTFFGYGQATGQVDGCRGLTDSPLLIGYCDYVPHNLRYPKALT